MPRSMPLTFFFNDTATTEIYTLSLHDALPISTAGRSSGRSRGAWRRRSNGIRWINLSLGDHWKIDVEQISRCAKLQPCSSGNLSERPFVAPLLVNDVAEERHTGEQRDLKKRREGGVYKRHTVHVSESNLGPWAPVEGA